MKRTRASARNELKQQQQQQVPVSPHSLSLLESPDALKSSTDQQLKEQKFQLVKKTASGKHGSVLFATQPRTPTPNTPGPNPVAFAIKKQLIKSPYNLEDRAYREVFILQQLNKLQNKKNYYPLESNYVGFVNWFKGKEDDQYMHYVLECADFTLFELKSMSLYEYKCILFQVLFALYVAQKEFEFMHNDLHMKNILLVRPEKENQYCQFQDSDTVWYTSGLIVKITDFGLSRIRMESGKVIYDKKNPVTSVFQASKDVEQVFSEFAKIRISADRLISKEEVENFRKKSINDGEKLSLDEITNRIVKEKRKLLNGLKALARKEAPLSQIIHHPFFDELKEKKSIFVTPKPKRRKTTAINNENAKPKFDRASTGFSPAKPDSK